VLEYEQLYADARCHGGVLRWMQAFHDFSSEWPYAVSFIVFAIHFWRYCCLLLHEFHHQHSLPVPVHSFRLFCGRQLLFKLFRLLWWMCVHPLLWQLFGFNVHKWNACFITCYSYDAIEKFTPSLWYRSK
jgi:hypothetical protein